MKDFFKALGFFAFFAIIIYLLFHPKHWWKTWIVVIGLYVIGSYGKAYHEEHRHDNYDHTPGSVYFEESLKKWKLEIVLKFDKMWETYLQIKFIETIR